jgi:5'-nucleotidase
MILITNDDGHQSEGLNALREAAQLAFPGEPIITVAPASEQSQIGHSVTTKSPLRVSSDYADFHTVAGTPADCVRVALFGLSLQPDFILSGINLGGNLGHDIPISGTVAAVREAAYHGISGVAISQYLKHEIPVCWPSSIRRTCQILRNLAPKIRQQNCPTTYNVNLPCLSKSCAEPEQRLTIPSCHPLPVSYEELDTGNAHNTRFFNYNGVYSSRCSEPGSDVECCFSGHISISRMNVLSGGPDH